MKLQRIAAVASVALVGAVALSGCGSDNNTTGATASASGGASDDSAKGSADCGSGTLTGEGSSAQKAAVEEVIAKYRQKCPGVTVNYNASGSGAGIKQFNNNQVDWAGSDSALKTEVKDGKVEVKEAEKRCGSPAWNIPMVTGPIAVGYNLKGVNDLVLKSDVIGKIFNGKITKWNDPAIAATNSGVKLPATPITVYFRSDESGTTDNFTKYLGKSAPGAFPHKSGKKWPAGVGEGKPQSQGVAQAVKAKDGGISYMEWAFAKDNGLGVAKVDNGGGPVALTAESAGKAVAAAKPKGQGNDLRLELDYATKAPGAYPIILVTYEIVCSKYSDAGKAKNVKSFLKHFASMDVQKGLEEIGYAPLPADVESKVETAIDAIQ